MRRPIMLAALALSLAAAAPAQAGWRIDRAQTIAATVWNHPCGGNIRLAWSTLPVAERAEAADCTVTLTTRDPEPWPVFCTTMIHEYGHLAGYRDPLNPTDPFHSHNPRSVMYATLSYVRTITVMDGHRTETWQGTDPRCAEHGRPYLSRHGDGTTR